jgi:hypothetical protein
MINRSCCFFFRDSCSVSPETIRQPKTFVGFTSQHQQPMSVRGEVTRAYPVLTKLLPPTSNFHYSLCLLTPTGDRPASSLFLAPSGVRPPSRGTDPHYRRWFQVAGRRPAAAFRHVPRPPSSVPGRGVPEDRPSNSEQMPANPRGPGMGTRHLLPTGQARPSTRRQLEANTRQGGRRPEQRERTWSRAYRTRLPARRTRRTIWAPPEDGGGGL